MLGDLRLFVDYLKHALCRSRSPLPLHEHEADHAERRCHDQHVSVERHDIAHRYTFVDGREAADEQHQRQAESGQHSHRRGVAGFGVGSCGAGPAQPFSRSGQQFYLAAFLCEGAHYACSLDVLVHDCGQFRCAGLCRPAQREDPLTES